MPKVKQFEAIDINDLIFGSGESMYLSMEEITEAFITHIHQVYKFLDQGRTVSIEMPIEECFYYLKKVSENDDDFKLTKMSSEPTHTEHLDGIGTVNWLFAKAPFISLVGYSNI